MRLLICALFLPGLAGPALAGDYVLGPQDVISLEIHVGGQKERDLVLTVSADGTVSIPWLGAVNASRMTIPELTALVTEELGHDYLVNPEVNIRVLEYHSIHYHITGAVKNPGLYEMKSAANVLELIAQAGGLLPTHGKVAFVIRDNADNVQSSRKLDLAELLENADVTQNPRLITGDVVYIPTRESRDVAESVIQVSGMVKNPGIFDYQSGMTALSACILAGGFDKFSAPGRTRIVRQKGEDRQVIEVDLDAVKDGKADDVNVLPGDLIHVPKSWL